MILLESFLFYSHYFCYILISRNDFLFQNHNVIVNYEQDDCNNLHWISSMTRYIISAVRLDTLLCRATRYF